MQSETNQTELIGKEFEIDMTVKFASEKHLVFSDAYIRINTETKYQIAKWDFSPEQIIGLNLKSGDSCRIRFKIIEVKTAPPYNTTPHFIAKVLSLKMPEGVILLHGLARDSNSMLKMQESLENAGYTVLNKEYESRKDSIENLSESAIGDALSDPKLSHCKRIHFVTHSMGGILVRSYFNRNSDSRLGRVVMLAPPNQGSEVVDYLGKMKLFSVINGPAGKELGTNPESTPNQLGEANFELGVISGDRSINWINSIMIEGKDDGKVSIKNTRLKGMKDHAVVHSTHPFIMKNKKAIDLTLRFLRLGSFSKKQ